MKRKMLSIVLCVCLVMLFCTGCFGKTKLNEGYDKEELLTEAESIIDAVHVDGVEKVLKEHMREDYLEKYPMDDTVEDFDNLRTSVGPFISYTQTTVIGQDSPDDKKEPFAVVAVTATYEDGELLFMLTFDLDLNLVSFYVKK